VGRWETGRRRGWCLLGVGGFLLSPLTLTACSTSCDKSAPTVTIVGRVTVRSTSKATFSIESVSPSTNVTPDPATPVLAPGKNVTVRYFADHAKYLRVGTRYRVDLFWDGAGSFESDVHTSDEPCSGGTVYANGSSINTASWTRSHITEIVLALVLAPVALAVIVLVIVRMILRLYRRRALSELPK
jgi:hypothetical protein